MVDGTFLPSVHVPETLKTIIQTHVNGLPEPESRAWLNRVKGYYEEGQCPFNSPPQHSEGEGTPRRPPPPGWPATAKIAAAIESIQLPAEPNTATNLVPEVFNASGAGGCHSGIAHPQGAGPAIPPPPGQAKEPVTDRIIALLAGTATDCSLL